MPLRLVRRTRVFPPDESSLIHVLHHTAAKGKFINEESLGGFAMWETGGDSSDILLDAIRSGIGIGGC